MYTKATLLEIIKNLCEIYRADGLTHEEIIDNLVCAGANVHLLHDLRFTDNDIDDYIYYLSQMTGESEDDIRRMYL